ncbi:MAG: (Fe-S)-binding protein [Polyangiales bacterium]
MPGLHLPLLSKRRPELETCALCPKLSRAVCPVSNADGKETTTPWGKMSAAYLLERGAVEATQAQAWPPWACTGCFACRQRCELGNDVAGTLLDARADLMANGLAPAAATSMVQKHGERVAASDRALEGAIERAKARGAKIENGAKTRILVGCLGARTSEDVAADAIVATARLSGSIDVVRGCCGSPQRSAGDREGFVRSARAMADRVAGAETLVVADAGCAHAIAKRYADVDAALQVPVLHLVELAAQSLPRLSKIALEGEVRYHDSCHLGRGLGLYDPPRAVLAAILGRSPAEFARRREEATCSGGGGGLPVTSAETARAIADARLEQHEEEGGGSVVTTCAASRKLLGKSGVPVYDLSTLLARSLEQARE